MAKKFSQLPAAVQSFVGDITAVSQGFPGSPVSRYVTETQRFDLMKTFMAADLPLVYTSPTATYSLNINATNLRLDGSDLNTIQDINTTASPEFARLSLNTSATTIQGNNFGLIIKDDVSVPFEIGLVAYGAGRTVGWQTFVARGTEGAPTISASGDFPFINAGHGYDGTNFLECAQIQARIDGNPGLGDMPGRLHFCTRDQGAGSCSIRMTIKGNGNIGIGTMTPDAAAILQTNSTTKGALFSPMTETQRDAIVSPPEGLELFNLTTHKKNFYNGTIWVESDDLPVFSNKAVPFGTASGVLSEDVDNFNFNTTNDTLAVGGPSTDLIVNGSNRRGSFLAISNGISEKWGVIGLAYSNTNGSALNLARARGSEAAPQAVNSGDDLGNVCMLGYNGTDYSYGASMKGIAAANFADGDTPTHLAWFTTKDNEEDLTEGMRLTSAQQLGINETAPTDRLHVSDAIENARIRIENTGVVGNRSAGYIQKNSAYEVFSGISGISPTQWMVYSNTDLEPRITVDLAQKNVAISDSGTTTTHNADVLLDLQSSSLAVKDPVLTTTARNLLTGVEGMRIFNTSTKQFEGYNGTSWVVLG